jgi:cytochrome c oxidase subunit 2
VSTPDEPIGAPADAPAEEQRPAHQKHPLAKMLLLGIVASVIGVIICLQIEWFPPQGSTQAEDIDTLYDVLMIVSVPIFVLVMTVAIYCVIAFRAKPGEKGDGAHIHGNTKLEVIWVTIPFLIVTALAVYSWIVLDDIEAKQPGEMIVNVTGEQFAWSFEYPDQGVKSNELVLPKDKPVFFQINAKDVLHSFWVPEFRMKQDAVPGIETVTRATPKELGTYAVVCAELCGIGHATMRQQVRVVPPAEFDSWVQERKKAGGETAGGVNSGEDADETTTAGRELFISTGCNACHTLDDANASAEVGPDLNELAAVAQDRKPGTSAEDYIRESIVDPPAFEVEGYSGDTMPGNYDDQLMPEEIDTLVEYLLGLSQTEEGE